MATGGRQNADAKLLAVLATGCTLAQAAEQVGVSERTISRRLEDPRFRIQLEKLKDAALSEAVSKLSSACSQAVETLRKLLECKSDNVRLGAARSVLELAVSMRASTELNVRITKLEERQNAQDAVDAASERVGGKSGRTARCVAG
jgi:transcriptional regulator with XRE-family HTH domain